jgi:maltose alpha-D-glucosyltransferase / alpha-amylase
MKNIHVTPEPLWFKDAIIYELHVKAFHDSNGDGIGDFKGLTQRLDYLEDLGVTAIWLLPFYPSPLRDDGYDIADYYSIHPDYGTMRDFKVFLREAHKRGLRVITELVINHTSDQHEWYQKSRRSRPGSLWRDFYVWSNAADKFRDARIIFKDFESSNWAWDPVAHAYYWHRFYSHQPDLNFDNPRVQEAIFKVMDYWFDMGVDGLRLDAIPYLFEREGTNCENLPETYEFLRKLRTHVDRNYTDKMLLAEANQWPEDAAAYFGDGDICHMAFHFPLMPRMFMSIRLEDRFPIIDILDQTPDIPENCQWALFLRNHDELTLEMVTDEERDYMYRVYAKDTSARINLGIRRRLAPLLDNNRRKIELMNLLLFSMPGTPVVYYGDEIGMGDNYYLGDRNGVRTPMQWSPDRNGGFSNANPQQLYLPVIIDPDYHYEANNVETNERSQSSLLWWMKRFISMRKMYRAFGRGTIEFLLPDNPKILAFIRSYENEYILVVVNMSRHSQYAELDLSKFEGYVPEEVFSRNKFPTVRNTLYGITLSSYGYFWFLLKKEEETIDIHAEDGIVEFTAPKKWISITDGRTRAKFARIVLPSYLQKARWFGGKARNIQHVDMIEAVQLGRKGTTTSLLLLIEVHYTEGLPEIYTLPVSFTSNDEEINDTITTHPQSVICRLKSSSGEGILFDAAYNEAFRTNLLSMITQKTRFKGFRGELTAYSGRLFNRLIPKNDIPRESQVLKADQSNTAILYGDRLFLKFYRQLDEGVNPDLELSRFLSERTPFEYAPPFLGALEYRRGKSDPIIIGTLLGYIQNEGDAWQYTLDTISRYIERVLEGSGKTEEIPKLPASLFDIDPENLPPILNEMVGGIYPERASILGLRTGQMHNAFTTDFDDPNFAPEDFSLLYQRSVFQSLQSHTRRVFQLARKAVRTLPEELRDKADEILNKEKKITSKFREIYKKKLNAKKIRIHGDYHLGQVLYTGKDFVIIDFEGEPARSLSERRLKRSPVVDVAGMIRSFHYAAHAGLFNHLSVRPEDAETLEPWIELWYKVAASAFLRSYLNSTRLSSFNPDDEHDFAVLLRSFTLEKAIYELGYEMKYRPDWIKIPMRGITDLLEE